MNKLGIIDRIQVGPNIKSVMFTSGSEKCWRIEIITGETHILPKQKEHIESEYTIYIVLIVVS